MKNSKNAALAIIANASKVPVYTPIKVKILMDRLGLNEKGLAILMNVTPMTVRLWTSGAVKPCGTSNRLMQIFEICPDLAAEIASGRNDKE
jgi:putative transcriptional regulator